jgi:hypothetical protein
MKTLIFETMEHYLCNGSYDLHVSEEDAALIQKHLGYAFDIDYVGDWPDRPFNLNRVHPVAFNNKDLAVFWKRKYEEECAHNIRMRDEVSRFKTRIEEV